MRIFKFAYAFLVVVVAVCGSRPALAISEAQRAYNACVDSYNNKYRFLSNYKAIVAGLDGDVLVFLPGAGEIRRAREACAKVAAEYRADANDDPPGKSSSLSA